MRLLLLDTIVFVAAINGRPWRVRERFLETARSTDLVVLSSIVWLELEGGAVGSKSPETTRRARDFLIEARGDRIIRRAFDTAAAEQAASIRAAVKSRAPPIGPYDVLIAGQALSLGATRVTANTREFSRVVDLDIVNREA